MSETVIRFAMLRTDCTVSVSTFGVDPIDRTWLEERKFSRAPDLRCLLKIPWHVTYRAARDLDSMRQAHDTWLRP